MKGILAIGLLGFFVGCYAGVGIGAYARYVNVELPVQLATLDSKNSERHNYKVLVFSPSRLRWYAYNENGHLVRSGKASGGAGYCPDIKRSCRTPRGVFHVISKGGANCRSSRYPQPGGGARMDYCIFFSKYYAIHGSNDVPNHNASHGCIRVLPSAAKWLNQNFLRVGDTVKITSY